MFNVTRTNPAPACLARNIYNDQEVVDRLSEMFLGKCYLCESHQLSEPEIEHLIPHQNNPSLKFNWNNLFFACRRCNGIKGDKHINILDCTNANMDVFREIRHVLPSIPGQPVQVIAESSPPSLSVQSTVELLWRCFNDKDTPLRAISHFALHEKLFFYYEIFLTNRNIVANVASPPLKVAEASDTILHMTSVSYPFSVFWRWHLLSDVKLRGKLKHLITF